MVTGVSMGPRAQPFDHKDSLIALTSLMLLISLLAHFTLTFGILSLFHIGFQNSKLWPIDL